MKKTAFLFLFFFSSYITYFQDADSNKEGFLADVRELGVGVIII